MERNVEAALLTKPRCPSCGTPLVYEVKLGWFDTLINKVRPIRKFFCVSSMSGKYIKTGKSAGKPPSG